MACAMRHRIVLLLSTTPRVFSTGLSVTSRSGSPLEVGASQVYRMSVSTYDYWCIQELAFYDSTGTQVPRNGNALAKTAYVGMEAANAFDGNFGYLDNMYCSKDNPDGSGWLQYEFPNAVDVHSYTVYGATRSNVVKNPSNWQMLVSNDGGTIWTQIDEQSGHGWVQNQSKTFSVTHAATPTPSPTSSPTPSPTADPTSSGVGDPHMQNIHGERFDLMKPGKHVLINIPQGSRDDAMLIVQADARRLGENCADLYP
eukprot:9504189-Pyramimonas_sp.AAC.5